MKEKTYTREELEELLTDQNKVFCREKLVNSNGGAYMIAYPNAKRNSAYTLSDRLLKKVKIQQYIAFMKQDLEELTGISKSRNLKALADIAYNSIAHLHDSWITLKEFDQITPDQLNAIDSIETETKKVVNGKGQEVEVVYKKIKMKPQIAAIQEINKMMDYYTPEKIDLTSNGESISVPNLSTEELIKRAKAVKAFGGV